MLNHCRDCRSYRALDKSCRRYPKQVIVFVLPEQGLAGQMKLNVNVHSQFPYHEPLSEACDEFHPAIQS